jgi:hypothetical protein
MPLPFNKSVKLIRADFEVPLWLCHAKEGVDLLQSVIYRPSKKLLITAKRGFTARRRSF